MIGIIATIKVKDGEGDAFEAVFRTLQDKVRANEAGAKLYQLTKSRTEPNTYRVLEIYADQEALSAHGQTDYFKEIGRQMGPHLDGRPNIEMLDIIG
ncbi:MAG: antibiotic biosynthesis monooxygenase [Alphaproteobacteria bacterium]|jgi:quinol monooxygenase YgiN|nr:antibiotic biosynthesis monooxygenase [Alphaproteobacteria bacterium]